MRCHVCGRDNPPDYVVCGCGQRRADMVTDPEAPTRPVTDRQPGRNSQVDARQSAPRADDATRYLCAAVQLDTRLNRKTIHGITEEPRRAIATSPGVDLATVLRHAFAARRRHVIRDLVLALLLIFVLSRLDLLLLGLALAWITIFVDLLIAYYGVLTPRLRRHNFDPNSAPEPHTGSARRHVTEVARRDHGNLTVFADYKPFIGHGPVMDAWSFTLNVAKPEEGKSVVGFTVHELYDHVADAVGRLELPGITVADRVFVSGLDLRHHVDTALRTAVLPDPMSPPAAHLDPSFLWRMREDPHTRARPYLAVQVRGWEGDLVVTLFLRFALLPHRDLLFVEASYSLLPPFKEKYQWADRLMDRPSPQQLLRFGSQAVRDFVPTFLLSIFRLLGTIPRALHRRMGHIGQTPTTMSEQTFNYGAALSPRELASDSKFARYFQQLDRDMYTKVAERRVMDALEEFLSEHNIDTTDLKERQTTILNNGVYVAGQGSISTQSLAAGSNAFARTANRLQPGARPTPQGKAQS